MNSRHRPALKVTRHGAARLVCLTLGRDAPVHPARWWTQRESSLPLLSLATNTWQDSSTSHSRPASNDAKAAGAELARQRRLERERVLPQALVGGLVGAFFDKSIMPTNWRARVAEPAMVPSTAMNGDISGTLLAANRIASMICSGVSGVDNGWPMCPETSANRDRPPGRGNIAWHRWRRSRTNSVVHHLLGAVGIVDGAERIEVDVDGLDPERPARRRGGSRAIPSTRRCGDCAREGHLARRAPLLGGMLGEADRPTCRLLFTRTVTHSQSPQWKDCGSGISPGETRGASTPQRFRAVEW